MSFVPFRRSAKIASSGALALIMVMVTLVSPVLGAPSDVAPAEGDATVAMNRLVVEQEADQSAPSQVLVPRLFIPTAGRHCYDCPDSTFGLQIYPAEFDLLPQAASLGARWARFNVSWEKIEPQNTTPENYNWSPKLDQDLALFASHGVHVVLTVIHNPSWAAEYKGGPLYEGMHAEMAQFMAALVSRYGSSPYNVKHWEIYNEPDNGTQYAADEGWGWFGHQPEEYVKTLQAIYGPIKQADPEAQVLLGGMAYDWFEDQGGPFVRDFLDVVLANGGANYFDMLNFHYYIAFRSNWDPYGQGILGKTRYLRQKMAEYGVSKPVVCTETGMWSSDLFDSDEEIQSRQVPQAYVRSKSLALPIVIWYKFVDSSYLGAQKWGLLDSQLNPKPAFVAYKTATDQLCRTNYVRTLDQQETRSQYLEAHLFRTWDNSTNVIAAWTFDGVTHAMPIASNQVQVLDKYGVSHTVLDGADGSWDGQVWLEFGPNPVYVRFDN